MSIAGTPLTLARGLRAAAARAPDKVAIRCAGRELTYAALRDRIGRVAQGACGGLGLRRGDTVALLAPNCLEFVELVAGLSEAGAIVVTLSPTCTATELRELVADSESRALFVHPALAELARDSCGLTSERIVEIGAPYETWLGRAGSSVIDIDAAEETDAFAMSYTSGTTGRPKGVLVSHRSRLLTFAAMAAEYGCYGPDDRALAIAPMCHGAGLAFVLAPLMFGGTVELLPRFDAEQTLRALCDGAATNLFVVPTHLHAMFELPPAVLGRYRPAALKTLICNAAPLPSPTQARALEHFGDGRLFECYGSTEGGIVSNLRPADQRRKQQCVGQPFAWTEIRLLDDAGAPVATGEVGEIHTRSPFLFNGYWRQPEADAEALRDGWLSVGDLGRQDDEGYLYIVGRKKDMVITGGLNVYPRDIEDVLQQHPQVLEACVVGLPDARWGERIVAALVLRGGAAVAGPALDDALASHCRERLARHKLPKDYVVIERVPRNATGKVLKRVLQQQLIDRPPPADADAGANR